jgi:hypothetical protein
LVGWLEGVFLQFLPPRYLLWELGDGNYDFLCRATHQHSHDGWTFGICVILGELPAAADMQGLFGIIFTD